MGFIAFFKKDYIVGLDIGTSSVKIAQFKETEDGLNLLRAESREFKPTDDKAIYEKEVLSALKALLKGIDTKKSQIIAHINCPTTTVKILKTPYMPKSELREGIKLEVKNYFPFPIDDSLLDFEILGDVVEKGVRKYEVAVAVSPVATVEKYLALLNKAGINPASFVPCPYALQKLAEYLPQKSEGATTCFIDIGEIHTELVILRGKTLMFSRKIPVAGRDFTKAMTGVLVSDRGKTELGMDEAEKIKRETGIPEVGEEKIIDDKISTTQISSMLRTPLEQFVSEIERCFDYYREETGGGKIDSIVLFGGGASLTGFIKFLSEELGIEVKLGDPTEGISGEKSAIPERDKNSYRLDLAIGAALGRARGINLLPPEIKEATKKVVTRGTIEAITTAVILVSLLLYVGMRIQIGNFDKRISVAKLELSSLQPALKKAEAHHAANMVLVDESHWEDVFRELGNLIPDNVHLTNGSMKDGVITMKGIVASEDGESQLSEFILTLERGMFKNVTLVKTRDLSDKSGNEFEINCQVD